jgi:hypothetical protein
MNNLSFGVKCHKVFCVGINFFANETCAYKVKYGVQNKRYWKGHTTKPLLLNYIMSNETYTCIFCKNLAFCESKCGACLLIIIGHPLSVRYNCLVVHVSMHNHPSAKGKN